VESSCVKISEDVLKKFQSNRGVTLRGSSYLEILASHTSLMYLGIYVYRKPNFCMLPVMWQLFKVVCGLLLILQSLLLLV